jgi:hypothetical protein
MKYVRSFFAFLYDFLVGDQWELFIGPIVVLVVCALLVKAEVPVDAVGLLFFIGIVGVMTFNLTISLRHAR